MNFQIRFDANRRIVRVCHFGAMSLADTMEAATQVQGKYGHLSPIKILVDVREAKSVMTLGEQRQFGRFLAELPGADNWRVAVVYKGSFNAAAAINRAAVIAGFCLADFILEAEALAWLSA